MIALAISREHSVVGLAAVERFLHALPQGARSHTLSSTQHRA